MADILIRGMEMPTTGNYFAMIENEPNHAPNVTIWKRKADGGLESFGFGEIIELSPHGDLIDISNAENALFVAGNYHLNDYKQGWNDGIEAVIENAPVVIPSNKEESE